MSRFPRMVCVAARPIRTAPHTTTGMTSATPARLRRQGILDLLERGSWGGAALSYARCRPPVNGFLRDLSSLSDFVPLKRSVILSSPLPWKGDGPDERGAVEAVGCGQPAAGRQADDGAGGPGPGALRPAGAAAAGPGGDGRAAGAATSQYGPRAGARARGGRSDAERPLA